MPLPLVAIGLGAMAAGGLYGALKGNQDEDKYKNRLDLLYNQTQNRQAPHLGAATQSGPSDFRGDQRALTERLTALSKGQGPSLAAEQIRQQTDQNIAAQTAQAVTGRGGNLAAFNAANNAQMLGAQAAQTGAIARTNEQMGAFNQLGSVINQGRESDQSNSQFNAQQQNFRDQANLEAQLRTMGMNDEQIRAVLMGNQSMAMKPTFGEQLMAGGAGIASMGAMGGKKA